MAVNYDSQEYLKSVDAYWRAANYLSVGQLFLMSNPLLKRELKAEDVKPKPIGHWGTIVPQNFIYAHLNRVIKKYDLDMFYIEGSGHGGTSTRGMNGAGQRSGYSRGYKNPEYWAKIRVC